MSCIYGLPGVHTQRTTVGGGAGPQRVEAAVGGVDAGLAQGPATSRRRDGGGRRDVLSLPALDSRAARFLVRLQLGVVKHVRRGSFCQELERAAAEVSWSTYHTSPRLKQERRRGGGRPRPRCAGRCHALGPSRTGEGSPALATTQAHGYRTTRGRAGRFKQDWPTLPRQLFDTLRSDVQELCEDLIGEVGNPTWSKK